jgi:integral membrane protein (TIGR00529 family)
MLSVVGVLIAFVAIVLLRIKNIDFSISILAGSFIIILTSSQPVEVFINAIMQTFTSPSTYNLASAVALITVLGYSLKETNLMSELIDGLRGFLPARILLALIPAIFGLLTMLGGALMSAPFNEPEAERLGLKPEQKTFINVWFRHLWYWASPLSPVPILAASLSNTSLTRFLRAQLPLFIITLAIGFIVGSRFIKDQDKREKASKGLPEILRGLTPIILAIILSAAGIPVWIALIFSLITIFVERRLHFRKIIEMIYSGVRVDLVAAVVAMMFFRFTMVSSESVYELFDAITVFGVPLLLILLAVPILVGSISGTPTMGIGIVFPLLLPLIGDHNIFTTSIVYAGIIAGYLASPMHLCLVLTNNYYKSELKKVYKYLIPSVAILYISAVTYYTLMSITI